MSRGFTLVELLVVIGIIAILAGILIPSLIVGRFHSRVTLCANNYRQWTLAAAAYAGDDAKGRLPSFPLPTDNMTGYGSIEPWFLAYEMVTNMGPYGVNVPMWFCPVRPWIFEDERAIFRVLRNRELATLADLVDEGVNFKRGAFMNARFMWWVPRRLGQSSLEFPEPALMKTRVPDPWPRQLSDATVSTQPIITDWLLGEWDSVREEAVVHDNSGGHQYGKYGSSRNINLGFADGHVETKPKGKIRWQARPGAGSHVYVY